MVDTERKHCGQRLGRLSEDEMLNFQAGVVKIGEYPLTQKSVTEASISLNERIVYGIYPICLKDSQVWSSGQTARGRELSAWNDLVLEGE